MSIRDILQKNDPRAFLEAMPTIPYPMGERIADIRARVKGLLDNIFISPFWYPWDLLHDIISIVTNCRSMLINDTLLTPETISTVMQQHYADDENKDQIREKLIHICAKVQELAQKMGIEKVDLYLSSALGYDASATQGINKKNLRIGSRGVILDPLDAIDFVIAHELTHLKCNHYLKAVGLFSSRSILYFIFLRSISWKYSIPLVMITNGVVSLFSNAQQRGREREADQGALNVLNTSTGMVTWLFSTISNNLQFKHGIDKPQTGGDNYTPIGNCRWRFTHPPLTERLSTALAFKPNAV